MTDNIQPPTLPALKHHAWEDLLGRAGSLSPSAGRATRMLEALDVAGLDTAIGLRVAELLEDFAVRGWGIAAQLRAIADGSSPLILSGEVTPSQLAGQLLAGVTVDGELVIENASDHGDDPDAIAKALEALAQRYREMDPDLRPTARLVAAFEATAASSAGEPGVAG